MFAQQNKLKELFEKYGWELIETQKPNYIWIAEIWLLKSLWSPTDCYVFIVFEVDPQSEVRVEKEKNVWAVSISLGQPQDWRNDNFDSQISDGENIEIQIRPNFEKHIPEIFDSLNNLRLKFNNLTN